jgi:hypothetical protein
MRHERASCIGSVNMCIGSRYGGVYVSFAVISSYSIIIPVSNVCSISFHSVSVDIHMVMLQLLLHCSCLCFDVHINGFVHGEEGAPEANMRLVHYMCHAIRLFFICARFLH